MNFFSVVLASTLTCQPVPDAGQNGFWEVTRSSKGGIGSNIEFRPDGSYSRAMTVIVDFYYEVRDSVLYRAREKSDLVSKNHGTRIHLKDDAYVVIKTRGDNEIRKKLAGEDSSTITGIFSYRHSTGAIAYERFTDDGRLYLRIPMRVENGCYSIELDEFTFSPENGPPLKMYFTSQSNRLVLESSDLITTYRLIPEGAWYHVDEVDYQNPKSSTAQN